MEKVREKLQKAEKNFKTNIVNAWIIYFLIIIGAFIYSTTITGFPQAFVVSIIVAVAGFVPFMFIVYAIGIKLRRIRLEFHSFIKIVNLEVIAKIKSQYDSDLISLSNSKAKQLSVGDSIVFFDETISVFRSWDSFLRLVNKFSLNDNIEINTEDLSSSNVNYKIQIKDSEIVGIRVIGTHAILGLSGSHNGFISDSSTSDEILEITYNKSDQLERLFLEIKYLKTFQSIFKDRIILEPSNQYGDGLPVPVKENEINQLKEIIANEKQSNDVVLQNTQTYESFVHIIYLSIAILFPFDILRFIASFMGIGLSWSIIADEKKNQTEKIVSSILIVVYILYALVVINYNF